MKLWEPKQCCCCCTPRIGTLVLGYLGVIGSILNILGTLRSLLLGKQEIANLCLENYSDENKESCYNGAITGMWISIVVEILWGVVCTLLILGTNKKKPQLLLPYMILQTIMLVVVTLTSIIGVIVLMCFGFWIFGLILIPCGGIGLFIATYFLLVVRVHYMEIKEGDHPNQMEFSPIPYKV